MNLPYLLQRSAARVRSLPLLRNLSPLWRAVRPAFDAVMAALSGGRAIELPMPLSEDRFRFDLAFRNSDFASSEAAPYRWVAEQLRPGMVFFDIGANIGFYTLNAVKRVGATGLVAAVEPQDASRRMPERHVRLNGFQDRVRILDCPAGDSDGVAVEFFQPSEQVHSGSSLAFARDVDYVDRSRLNIHRKTMRTVDSLAAELGRDPDVLKIDVEGAELRVLRGAERVLRRRRPTALSAVHPFWMAGLQDTVEDLAAFVASVGYRMVGLDGSPRPKPDYEEVLLLPPETGGPGPEGAR
jgi:FkbM family methyltransferase